MHLQSVDFPHPDGPAMRINSESLIESETSFKAGFLPSA
jgi:hypothetical protein